MIDWENLARRVGATLEGPTASGATEHGSSGLARRALEQVLDASEWIAAVDHYVERRPGSELVRSVLWLVHPWPAMERCREIAQTSVDVETRRCAVELLRVVADDRALPWMSEFLQDGDPLVELWAAGVVDQLLFAGLVEEEQCKVLLDAMEHHGNSLVRQVYTDMRASDEDDHIDEA